MDTKLPTHTNGVVIDKDNTVTYQSIALPKMTKDHVMVKVHSGILNPSDTWFLAGLYPAKKIRPGVCGFEGSGTVIATGESSKFLANKRIAFMGFRFDDSGSYGETAVIHKNSCLVLPDGFDLEQGAGFFVNPWTAQCFILICKQSNWNCIVHTGANGALGRMLIRLCKEAKITLINIVRKHEQIAELKSEMNAEHVLNSSSPNFEKEMKDSFRKLKPQGFFDCVSGELGTQIIKALPRKSVTYSYGALSFAPYELMAGEIMFLDKTVKGFWLTTFLMENTSMIGDLGKSTVANSEKGSFGFKVAKRFALEDYQAAIDYYTTNSSLGKVLLQSRQTLTTPKL